MQRAAHGELPNDNESVVVIECQSDKYVQLIVGGYLSQLCFARYEGSCTLTQLPNAAVAWICV
jgi:hypothetical protein